MEVETAESRVAELERQLRSASAARDDFALALSARAQADSEREAIIDEQAEHLDILARRVHALEAERRASRAAAAERSRLVEQLTQVQTRRELDAPKTARLQA